MPNIQQKIRMNIYLDTRQKAGLETMNKKTGAPVAELVRRAVDAFLESDRKQGERKKP
jgi:hypothetical protein